MCINYYLLSPRFLPSIKNDLQYPQLSIEPVETAAREYEAIQEILPALHVYRVSPSDLCGCYLSYVDRAEQDAHLAELRATPPPAEDPEEARKSWEAAAGGSPWRLAQMQKHPHDRRIADSEWLWEQGYQAVASLARFLSDSQEKGPLSIYVVWERDEGKPITTRHTILPTFFGGARFHQLPEHTLLTVVRENPSVTEAPGPEGWI